MTSFALSIALLVGANAADTASSWHGAEANALLAHHGTFDTRSASIKLGSVSVLVVAELLMKKKWRSKLKLFNYGEAAATGVVAIRNWTR